MDAMTSADGVEAALGRLAWLALRATGADRCAIFVADTRDEIFLRPAAGASRTGDLAELWDRFRAMSPVRLTGELHQLLVGERSGAVAISEAGSSALVPEDWRRSWAPTSLAIAPMRAGGELVGVLAVDHVGQAPPFRPREVKPLEAIASAAGTALRGALLVEQLQTRVRVTEALHRVSDAVLGTSNLKAALTSLNRDVCTGIGIECVRLSLADPLLAELLRVPKATEEELALIRGWRRVFPPEPDWSDSECRFPVLMGRRPAGILRVLAPKGLDAGGHELVHAIAAGLGEVAFKARLRKTAERRSQALAVAAERERIARDLHDTVGQTLFGIGLKLQDILCEIDDPAVAARLAGLRERAAQGVSDVRSAVYALSFLHVRERGFVPSLRTLARRFSLATGVPAELRLTRRLPALDEDVEGALFRVAHEALANVERHARATGVVLSLDAVDDAVELVIRDDGVGLTRRDGAGWRSSAHFGLRSMARSMEEIGGRIDIGRGSPRGLVIRARASIGPSRGGDR
jgi:signal transduction histidine kinase